MDCPELSIIFGTFNRLPHLKKAVDSIRSSAEGISYEIIVADGGSSDGSRAWLETQKDVVVIDGGMDGAVVAFNKAWQASRGKFIANFNDDSEYLGDALRAGVKTFSTPGALTIPGQVAFESDLYGQWKVESIHGFAYANFGITRRDVVQKVCAAQCGPSHFWNPIYHTYAADCEHSCWVWKLGHTVMPLPGCRVKDHSFLDALRARNDVIRANRGDSTLFWKRWPDQASMCP